MHNQWQKAVVAKLYCIAGAWLLAIIIIVGRLAHLQINLAALFYTLGQKNFLRQEKITSPRGNILDSSGKLLATNRPIISVAWRGTGNRSLSEHQVHVLKTISFCLNRSCDITQELLLAEKLKKNHVLASEISFKQLACLTELLSDDPNLAITTTFKRYYPHACVACHILGYLASCSEECAGTMGLEKIVNEHLQGENGLLERTITSVGKHMSEHQKKAALVGKDIHTTLNLDLQLLAEEIFPAEYSGSFVIMDARTGGIEALVSRPHFDPSFFLNPLTHEEWQEIQKGKPLINRAFSATYPPASLFKLITTAAALENKLVTTEESWYCRGHIHYAGRDYHCNNLYGHGKLTLKEGLAKSCNIPFYAIAKKIKIDVLADYAHKFGLGAKTNMLFPEKKGLVPTSAWKKETLHEPWWPGENLSACIGQSYLLVTPIQMARMISGICQGYLVKPRILIDEDIEIEPLLIKEETLQFLRASMQMVVQLGGSGQRLRRLNDIEIYAKTGTAQVPPHECHGWFVSHIKYREHKPITLVFFIEHAGSAQLPTKLAQLFIVKYRKLMNDYEKKQQEFPSATQDAII